MSYNGSGTFLINSAGQPVVANTVISATVFNALTADLATGLSTAITKDGQTTVTANIPFGNNKITTLGAGTAATDAANLGQVQSTAAKLITVTGTDTITGSMSPQLTAYAAGQLLYFIANAANTGAVTINVDGLGAKAITRDGSTALAAGDINSGEVVVIVYDGTRFQMINAANSFGNTTINGTLTVTGNTGLQANVSITSALSVGGTFNVTGVATLGSTLSVTGKSDLPTVSTASINAAVALITTGTVTNLTATGASIASANIGNLQFTAASIASINAGVAVVTNLTATSASIASANVGTAVITTGTVTNLTSTSASIASANAAVALVTTGTVTNLTSTSASIASANLGTAVVTGLTVTGASIASVNVGAAVLSGNLTLSGGTANGVLYLNASKVATSGSALTFDGTNLTASRGIKTGNDGITVSGFVDGVAVGGYDSIGYAASPGTALAIGGYRAAQWSAIYFYTAGAVQAALSSTGLGIGTTSPAAKLDVKQTGVGSATSVLLSRTTANVLDEQRIVWKADDLTLNYAGIAGVVNSGTTGSLHFQTATAGTLATKAILDASGNLGLGVTPSAWGSGRKSIMVDASTQASFVGSGVGATEVMSNAYFDGSNFKYIATGHASYFSQITGTHAWYTAPSGTAGNTITFTQAMELNASGGLKCLNTIGVGNATPSTSGAGVTFPATQSASSDANTLDDYEEGTWTGTLKGGTTDPTTPVTATGKYTKIGRQVTVAIYFENVNTTGAAGYAFVSGLPFTEDGTRAVGTAATYNFDLNTGTSVFADIASTSVYLVASKDDAAWIDVLHNAGAGRYLRITVTYFV